MEDIVFECINSRELRYYHFYERRLFSHHVKTKKNKIEKYNHRAVRGTCFRRSYTIEILFLPITYG